MQQEFLSQRKSLMRFSLPVSSERCAWNVKGTFYTTFYLVYGIHQFISAALVNTHTHTHAPLCQDQEEKQSFN